MNFKMVALVSTLSFLSIASMQGEEVTRQEKFAKLSLDEKSVQVAVDSVIEHLSQDDIKTLKKIIDDYRRTVSHGDAAGAVNQLNIALAESLFSQIKIQNQQAQSLAGIKTAVTVIATVLTIAITCHFLANYLRAMRGIQ